MFEITAERPEDAALIESLLDETFGPDRHAKASYRYRDGVAPERRLCLVARERGRVVGSIRHWPVVIGEAATPALLLGPVAVAADLQGCGVGRALVHRGLAGAAALGHRIVLLVSDLDYYRRFGFRPAPPAIVMPGERSERLLVTALAEGALEEVDGTVRPARGESPSGSCLRRRPAAGPQPATCSPPLTCTVSPVMKLAQSLHKKAITRATSSG